MGCKSKYIKSQIDYGFFKGGRRGKRIRRKGTHIIRQRQKRELMKIINACSSNSY